MLHSSSLKSGENTNIIAGYPWFGSWGRDTFISLARNLALARKSEDLYAAVIDTQVRRMKGGLFPNMGDNDNPAFNSVDAPLWFFQALYSYGLDQKETWKRYGNRNEGCAQRLPLRHIVWHPHEGKRPDIFRCSRQGTYMDGCCGPRRSGDSPRWLCG
jgi:hypothetical protein